MDGVLKYLRLDDQYRQYLGGLRWSTTEDLLEYEDGRTFAFNEEMALFLEGFGSVRPLVHFGFILHLLEIVGGSRLRSHPAVKRLRHAYEKTGKSLRNAGVFCALLCAEVPPQPSRLDPWQISLRLRNTAWPIRQVLAKYHDSIPADFAPVGPAAFERRILEALQTYSDLELYSWLRHGHLPLEGPAEEVARQIVPPEARTLSGLMEELLERPRLAGVRPFVAQMVSALTLPPRRLAREEIPVGGYADVATHGQVEQILPSQFALDDLEFVRRYAERELLYFRREEPNQRTKQEMVVVLDQGVRTWGEVRLLLSAAVMALARQADRRRIPFLLRCTSMAGGWIDPIQANAEAVAEVLEASDLSPHPGYALEWALEQSCTGARDIVLLTHPRSLSEPDVRAAIKRLTPEARLFTLSVDRGGSAVFDEIKRGAHCPVRRFQIDLGRTDAAPLTPRERPSGVRMAWEGDVEPIGFPFCFGPSGRVAPHLFQFDLAGEWLLAPDTEGMLYAWKTDGSDMEILPRGLVRGALLQKIDAVLGAVDGFVVVGRIDNELVAVHYDFIRRIAKAHTLGNEMQTPWEFFYIPEQHSVLARDERGGFGQRSLDLATGNCHAAQPFLATWGGPFSYAQDYPPSGPRRLNVLNAPAQTGRPSTVPCLYFESGLGRFVVDRLEPRWPAFQPQADGQPILKGCTALAAECRGATLAVLFDGFRSGIGRKRLCIFSRTEGKLLTEFRMNNSEDGFTLSSDGRLLCRKTSTSRLAITPIPGVPGQSFLTACRGYAQPTAFWAAASACMIETTRHNTHLLRWHDRGLEVIRRGGDVDLPKSMEWLTVVVPSRDSHLPEIVRYDKKRFTFIVLGGVIMLVDRYGQIVFLDWQSKLLCMAFAYRDKLALWMPDGTCYGPASLTGRPATRGALEKIGHALWKAAQGGSR